MCVLKTSDKSFSQQDFVNHSNGHIAAHVCTVYSPPGRQDALQTTMTASPCLGRWFQSADERFIPTAKIIDRSMYYAVIGRDQIDAVMFEL